MELSKQVVSLELAQKLKKLGLEQESLFVWRVIGTEYKNIVRDDELLKSMDSAMQKDKILKKVKYYSAYTVAELGEMLPIEATVKDNLAKADYNRDFEHRLPLHYSKYIQEWEAVDATTRKKVNKVYYLMCLLLTDRSISEEKQAEIDSFKAKSETEADARAKMLIWLIENGYINFKKEDSSHAE